MDINYDYYKVFYCAAKYGSLTQAANILMINQPNVTRTIKILEQRLNCTLFYRSRRGISLTAEGKRLYDHVKNAIEQIEEGERELSDTLNMKSGSLSIASTDIALRIYLLEKLRMFHEKYPDIKINLSTHTTSEVADVLRRGMADIAFLTTPYSADKETNSTTILEFREILVCGPRFEKLAKKTLTLKEVADFPMVSTASDSVTFKFHSSYFLNHGAYFRPLTEVSTTDQVLSMVAHDMGLAFLPKPFVKEETESGKIFEIKLSEQNPQRQICMLQGSRRPLSTAANKFVAMTGAEPE